MYYEIGCPHISASSNSLEFSAFQGGQLPEAKTFRIANDLHGDFSDLSIESDVNWLDCNINPDFQRGINEYDCTVEVTSTSLGKGINKGNIVISSSNATNSPDTISVSYDIVGPEPEVSPGSFQFEAFKMDHSPKIHSLPLKIREAARLIGKLKKASHGYLLVPMMAWGIHMCGFM